MNNRINILFAILGVFVLAGCESPLTGIKGPVSGASGIVAVSIQTPQTAASTTARTIHPALDGFSRYELSFSEGPMAHAPVEIHADGNTSIDLVVGDWTIIATAYKGETASARGSATVTISAGATTPVSIILGPVPEGSNGTLSYSVTSPSGAEGSLTVQTITGGAVAGGSIPLMTGTTSANTLSFLPGEYLLFISLTRAGMHAGRADVLHIYPDMTSVAEYSFTGDDFIGVETLNPEYAAFTGVAGATALPSNAAAINAAKGGNTAVFAIVDGGPNVATINASTGELTLVGTGEIRVSLAIATASGVVTHIGTSASIAVTATSADIPLSGLAEQLAWLSSYAVDGGDYLIELKANETIDPTSLYYGGKTVKITLKGDTAERTVSLGNTGSLFTVGSGVTLTLDNNVTLQGRSDNTASLVRVNSHGTLAMKGNAKITGNTALVSNNMASYGGGVSVSGSSFTMSDNASVSGNTAFIGGGVYVSDGSFTMSDNASVSGNTASSSGGGVSVDETTFTMSGNASVSDNTASSEYQTSGGGVSAGGGSFTMSDSATVSGNTASSFGYGGLSSSSGGGVSVGKTIFTMSGNAAVTGNMASYLGGSSGGGVNNGGTFIMRDNATVSGNTASAGGRVFVHYPSLQNYVSFTMSGNATVSGNTASAGGRVFVFTYDDSYGGGIFTKTGGVIYGSNEMNATLRNTVKDSAGVEQTNRGVAVYVDGTHWRETTVGAAQNLFASYNNSQWTFTGQWDETAVGSANITVGFNYGEIIITGSDGSNVISKSGAYGPSSLSLSATGYTNVIWYVDGSSTGISGSPVTLNATTYSAQRHSIIFTGTANGLRYSSQPIPFAVLP